MTSRLVRSLFVSVVEELCEKEKENPLLFSFTRREIDERPVLRLPHLGLDVRLEAVLALLLKGLDGLQVTDLREIGV